MHLFWTCLNIYGVVVCEHFIHNNHHAAVYKLIVFDLHLKHRSFCKKVFIYLHSSSANKQHRLGSLEKKKMTT